MMHSRQMEYDYSSYFRLIEDEIKSADLAVANIEFTLAGEPYSGYPCFSAPDDFAEYIADCGFDVFLAANNHILDKGSEGAERTIREFRRLGQERGITFTGLAGNEEEREDNYPLIIRRKGISIAFLNFTYGTNLGPTAHWPKTNYMGAEKEVVQALSKAEAADLSIALPHWGNEYELRHSKRQEELAGWLADKGADLIIGSHPHVVQDTARVNGIPVVYSLGNAVSNMSAENTQLELMVTLRIARHGNGDLSMLPLGLTWLWCSRPGGYTDTYIVIPIEEYIGRKEEWTGKWDYEKMVTTYNRITENY